MAALRGLLFALVAYLAVSFCSSSFAYFQVRRLPAAASKRHFNRTPSLWASQLHSIKQPGSSNLLGGVLVSLVLAHGGRVQLRAGFGGKDLTGKWGCFKTEGDVDAYWKAAGLPWFARKGLEAMEWGAGKNTNYREFLQEGNDVKMEYSFDGPGMGGLGFTETYTVGKGVQKITRVGGATILVDPVWESDSVLKVSNMSPPDSEISFGFVPKAFRKLFTGSNEGEEAPEKKDGTPIDVHRFYMDGDALILEADSTVSGGPVVKWFLRK